VVRPGIEAGLRQRTCLFTILAVRQFQAGDKLSVNILAACTVLSAVKYALPMMA
jgi:hypothetical protein